MDVANGGRVLNKNGRIVGCICCHKAPEQEISANYPPPPACASDLSGSQGALTCSP